MEKKKLVFAVITLLFSMFTGSLNSGELKPGKVKCFGNIEAVFIKGGTFIMGSPENEKERDNDERQHKVTLSSFWIGKYEITQKQYTEITGTNPAYIKGGTLPAEGVSWYDAVEFCNILSKKNGLKPYYAINKIIKVSENRNGNNNAGYIVTITGGNGFRLPSEAEWEYACRAGTTTAFSYGNSLDCTMANFDGEESYNAGKGTCGLKAVPVGSYKPNAYGLFDMHGNIQEWCLDWYGEYDTVTNDPKGAGSGDFKVIRSGGFDLAGKHQRSASRSFADPQNRWDGHIGFRIAYSAE